MRRNVSLARREKGSSYMSVWSIVGGVALIAVAAGVIWSFPDIRRYIKMKRM